MNLAYIDHRIKGEADPDAKDLIIGLSKKGFDLFIADSYKNFLDQGYTINSCIGILIHPDRSDYCILNWLKNQGLPR